VPWTLVEANDKNYARVKILRTLCASLEKALDASGGKASKVREAQELPGQKQPKVATSGNKNKKSGKGSKGGKK
jgi:hypothetical protein